MGKNFKASTIIEITTKIKKERGLLEFTKSTPYNCIWTYKYQEQDSTGMRQLFRKKEDLIQDMKSKCEVGSSSKRIRLD